MMARPNFSDAEETIFHFFPIKFNNPLSLVYARKGFSLRLIFLPILPYRSMHFPFRKAKSTSFNAFTPEILYIPLQDRMFSSLLHLFPS
jgi:hypothetical protein